MDHRPVRLRRIGGLLGTAAMLAVAAVPAPDPTSTMARPAVQAGDADLRLVADGSGVRPDDPRGGFLDQVRAAAHEGRPLTVRDILSAHAARLGLPAYDHPEGESPEPAGHAGTDVYAVPTGDIDGDGLGDLYAVVFPAGGDARVEARRGTDGTVLWTADAAGATDLLPLPAGDLDGDGAPDLLLWAFTGVQEYDERCDDDGCTFTYRTSGAWRYGVASGTDGTTRWLRQVPTQLSETYEERSSRLGYEYSVVVSGTNPYLVPWIAGDLDGDGRSELAVELVETIDLDLRWRTTGDALWLARRDEASYALDIVTSLTSVGADGTDRGVLARADGSGLAVGGFADLDGDGLGDVHLVEYTPTSAASDCVTAHVVGQGVCLADERTPAKEALVAVAGNGTQLWRADMGEASLWAWHLPDVDGDGGADLLVNDLVSGGSGVRSGRDGVERWWLEGDPERFSLALPAGDLDADGTVDVARLSDGGGDPDAAELAVTIERYAGADGAPRATTRYAEAYDPTSEWVSGSVGVWLDHELDGGPGADLAVELRVTDDDGTRGGITFERGADGAPIQRLPADDGTIVGLVDLTGDDTDDVVTVANVATMVICEIHEDGTETCAGDGDTRAPALSARRLPDLAPLWHHDTAGEDSWRWVWPVGDLDGLPGSEVLEEVFLMTPDAAGFTSGFVVRDGTDLTPRWGFGATAPD